MIRVVHSSVLSSLLNLILGSLFVFIPVESKNAWGKQPPWAKAKKPTLEPSQSIGGYAFGCILGAKILPEIGTGFHSIRRYRNRYYGHALLIDVIQRMGKIAQEIGIDSFEVGDLSQPRGGRMSYGHKSHQIGLDADIWFGLSKKQRLERGIKQKYANKKAFARSHPSLVNMTNEEIDKTVLDERHIQLLMIAANQPEVARIFVHWRIKAELCAQEKSGELDILRKNLNLDPPCIIAPKSMSSSKNAMIDKNQISDDSVSKVSEGIVQNRIGSTCGALHGDERPYWLRKIRPWWSHNQHFHVRLHCPKDSPFCEEQGPLPPDLNCEQLTWYSKVETRRRKKRVKEEKRKKEQEEKRLIAKLSLAERKKYKREKKAQRAQRVKEKAQRTDALYRRCHIK